MKGMRHILLGVLAWMPFTLGAQATDSIPHLELGQVNILGYPPYASLAWSPPAWSLASRPERSLGDLLQTAPSALIKEYGPGGLATPTLRGMGAGQTQVYWCGMLASSPLVGQSDLSLGHQGTQGRAELLPGGASLTLGSGGMGGALNIAPRFDTARLRINLQGGSFGTAKGSGLAHYDRGRLRGQTTVAGTVAQHNFPLLATPDPDDRQPHNRVQQVSGLQSLRWDAGRGGTFLVHAMGYAADRELPPPLYTTNLTETQSDRGARGHLEWGKPTRLGELSVGLTGMAEAMDYRNELAAIHSEAMFGRAQFMAQLSNFNASKTFDLRKVGLQVRHDMARNTGFAQAHAQTLAGAFAHLDLHLGRLQASLVGRQEWIDGKLPAPMGFLGASYHFSPSVRGRVNVSRNYRRPTLNERYWVPGGNPSLRPESGYGGEAGVGWILDKGHRWMVDLAGYSTLVHDLILWLPGTGAIWSPLNVGRVWARGLEAQVEGGWNWGRQRLRFSGSYAFTRSQRLDALSPGDAAEGKQLMYTPLHLGRLQVRYDVGKWEVLYLQVVNGRRFTSSDNSAWLPAYTTGDVGVGRSFGFGAAHGQAGAAGAHVLHVEVGATNIWNVEYQAVANRPMPGRGVYGRIEWTLKERNR